MVKQAQYKTRKVRPIGDALKMRKNPLGFLQGIIAETNGASLIPFQTGPLKNVLVNDASLVRELLNNYEKFDKNSVTYKEIRKMFDNGIIFSNGDEWRHNRKAINPAFHKQAIEGYFSVFATRGSELARTWKENKIRNIYADFVETTVNITLDIFFDFELSDEDKKKIVNGNNTLLNYTQVRLLRGGLKFPDFIPVQENRAIAKAKRGYQEVIKKIYGAKSSTTKKGERITIIELLLNSQSYYGGPMTPEQISAEASGVMLASTETTASLLMWMFYELSQHPAIKKRITDEITSTFGVDETITVDKLKQLSFCRQTINEVLRLYPPVWMVTRSLRETSSLGNQEFKKGTTFYFTPYTFQRDSSVWEEAELFNPDRFSPGRYTDVQKLHYMPFVSGPRKCIGEEFAIWETLIIMTRTIPYFDWVYPETQAPRIEFNATMRPLDEKGEYNVPMRITPRVTA